MASNVPQSSPPPPPPNWGAAPPPPSWNAAPAGGAYAYGGFWIRFVAFLIDTILLNIVAAIIGAIIGIAGTSIGPAGSMTVDSGGGIDMAQALAGLIGLVIGILYFPLMESSANQATLGKMAVGVKVIKSDGTRLSFGRALGRYFAKFISGIILGIGYIMAAFTDRKRALHDMIADTLVVKAR